MLVLSLEEFEEELLLLLLPLGYVSDEGLAAGVGSE
jgi:hypothetical protein